MLLFTGWFNADADCSIMIYGAHYKMLDITNRTYSEHTRSKRSQEVIFAEDGPHGNI